MFKKNKQKAGYGTFALTKAGYRKTVSKFAAALVIVIFVWGAGMAIYKSLQKNPEKTATVETSQNAIPGWWLQKYFGYSVCAQDNCGSSADPDRDKLSNAQEFYYHTNPLSAFTVKDKLNDGELVAAGFDPSRPGRMTFEQVTSEDNILGESLVFNSDIKKLINESVDLSSVRLPQINDSELTVVKDTSEAVKNYLAQTKEIFNKYIPKNIQENIDSSSTQSALKQTALELRKVEVPQDFLQFHKYLIAYFQLLPDVMNAPPADILNDDTNPVGNVWYDKAQATFSLLQKISLENQRLQNKYE